MKPMRTKQQSKEKRSTKYCEKTHYRYTVLCAFIVSLSLSFFHLVDVTFKFYSNRRRRSLQRWWNLFCMYSSRWRNALRTTVFHTLISLWPIYYVIIEYTVFTAVVAATNRYFAICSVAIITPHLSNKQ